MQNNSDRDIGRGGLSRDYLKYREENRRFFQHQHYSDPFFDRPNYNPPPALSYTKDSGALEQLSIAGIHNNLEQAQIMSNESLHFRLNAIHSRQNMMNVPHPNANYGPPNNYYNPMYNYNGLPNYPPPNSRNFYY